MRTKTTTLSVTLALLLAGCAGLGTRPAVPVVEVPPGQYEARAFIAMAPPRTGDGEDVAAVVYTIPGGRRVDVWDSPRWYLWEKALGPGTGKEHLALVKSPAHYQVVSLPGRDGRPIGYAVLHRVGVHGSVQDMGSKSVLMLSTLYFLDQNYINDKDGKGH